MVKKSKVSPQKSRAPFYGLLAILAIAGASGIWYAMKSAQPKPIVLSGNTAVPKSDGYLRGDPNAKVTIMEFADFECPGCGQFAALVEPDLRSRIIDSGLANFRYYDFPLVDIHPNTMAASLAAACADEQGKFWEMHDAIYQGQYDWNTQATSNPKKVFATYVARLGLNEQQWNQCFDEQKYVSKIEAHRNEGIARQVGTTPTLVIGNQVFPGGLTYDKIKKIVDSLNAIAGPSTDSVAASK